MRKLKINVNGNSYDVEVEEVGGAPAYSAPVAAPAVSEVAPVPVAAAKSAAPVASGSAGAVKITSPMPGNIVGIKVAVGDSVKSGDILCILEAMKMENEIMAPSNGTIASINVNKGANVNTGDLLISMN